VKATDLLRRKTFKYGGVSIRKLDAAHTVMLQKIKSADIRYGYLHNPHLEQQLVVLSEKEDVCNGKRRRVQWANWMG
jgi:hypothetical protein